MGAFVVFVAMISAYYYKRDGYIEFKNMYLIFRLRCDFPYCIQTFNFNTFDTNKH